MTTEPIPAIPAPPPVLPEGAIFWVYTPNVRWFHHAAGPLAFARQGSWSAASPRPGFPPHVRFSELVGMLPGLLLASSGLADFEAHDALDRVGAPRELKSRPTVALSVAERIIALADDRHAWRKDAKQLREKLTAVSRDPFWPTEFCPKELELGQDGAVRIVRNATAPESVQKTLPHSETLCLSMSHDHTKGVTALWLRSPVGDYTESFRGLYEADLREISMRTTSGYPVDLLLARLQKERRVGAAPARGPSGASGVQMAGCVAPAPGAKPVPDRRYGGVVPPPASVQFKFTGSDADRATMDAHVRKIAETEVARLHALTRTDEKRLREQDEIIEKLTARRDRWRKRAEAASKAEPRQESPLPTQRDKHGRVGIRDPRHMPDKGLVRSEPQADGTTKTSIFHPVRTARTPEEPTRTLVGIRMRGASFRVDYIDGRAATCFVHAAPGAILMVLGPLGERIGSRITPGEWLELHSLGVTTEEPIG